MAELGGRGGVQLEFPIYSYFNVQQLSSQVRRKWEEASAICEEHSRSLIVTAEGHQDDQKQTLAYDRKKGHKVFNIDFEPQQVFFEAENLASRLSTHQAHGLAEDKGITASLDNERVQQHRARRLVAKLAEAEMKRQMKLDERKRKASCMLQRALLAAERLSERQTERAARLDAKLEQAEKARESLVAAAALRGSEKAAHARAVSAANRAREELEGSRRRAEWELKLQRAGDARYEMTQTMLSSLALRQAEPFLVRRSLTRSILRRQSSSRMIQRCWRAFKARRGTTCELARCFRATGVPATGKSAFAESEASRSRQASTDTCARRQQQALQSAGTSSDPPSVVVGVSTALLGMPAEAPVQDAFEDFAGMLQSQATLRAATRLLRRLALKSTLALPEGGTAGVKRLLRRLFPKAERPDRYPARVFLCAYMILRHPKEVFNQSGEREASLSKAALEMEDAFGKLMEQLFSTAVLKSPRPSARSSPRPDSLHSSSTSKAAPTSAALQAFDSAWVQYLEQFVAWKSADAASLEAELVRVACEMETSMQKKLTRTPSGSSRPQSAADRQAMVEQVARDHELLRERIVRLGGQSGITRLEAGLAAARAAAREQPYDSSPATSPNCTPQNSPTKPPAASWSPPSPSSAAPPASGAAVTNETLAWELLYNLDYQLSSEEAEASWRDATGETNVMKELPPQLGDLRAEEAPRTAQIRVRRIAEAAFWDSLSETGAENVASLLSELASQLAEALPPRSRLIARVESQLNKNVLLESISMGSAESLLPAFDLLAGLLLESGSEAREAPAVRAHAEIRARLRESGRDLRAITRQLVRALRLMAAQLRLLQIDMSNSTLRMLAASLAGREGIRYAQQKFRHRLNFAGEAAVPDLGQHLPHTRAWLAQASGLLAALPPATSVGSPIQVATGVPETLRAGRNSIAAAPHRPAKSRSCAALITGESAKPRTWRGLVRIALVQLACAETHMSSEPSPLPETLCLDTGRIHAVKDAFQRLLVLSACLLISQQAALDSQAALPEVQPLLARLKGMMSDHSLELEGIAAELARAVQPSGEAGPLQDTLATALKRMLSRNSAGFKALSAGLTKVLQQMLLGHGLTPTEQRSALARFGAAGLQEEVQELAGTLMEMAAVTEAVHEPIYSQLALGLL